VVTRESTSAKTKDSIVATPPIIVLASVSSIEDESCPNFYQFEKAAVGPPVVIANANSTGMPDIKFIELKVAAQFSVYGN
jgi:hypothetical protein